MAACVGRTKDGRPCPLARMKGGPWCWNHHPAMGERRAAGSRLGGLRAHHTDLKTAAGRRKVAARVALALEAGTMSQRRADAILRAIRTVERMEQREAKLAQAQQKHVLNIHFAPWAAEAMSRGTAKDGSTHE